MTTSRSRYVSSFTSNSNSILLTTSIKSKNKNHDDTKIEAQKNTTNDTASKSDAINVEKPSIDERAEIVEKPFDIFWNNYPRKVGKQKCHIWFKAHKVNIELLEKMIASINGQKQSDQWQKDNGAFIPHPYTWLNQGRWEDEAVIELANNIKPINQEVSKPADASGDGCNIDEIIDSIENLKKQANTKTPSKLVGGDDLF